MTIQFTNRKVQWFFLAFNNHSFGQLCGSSVQLCAIAFLLPKCRFHFIYFFTARVARLFSERSLRIPLRTLRLSCLNCKVYYSFPNSRIKSSAKTIFRRAINSFALSIEKIMGGFIFNTLWSFPSVLIKTPKSLMRLAK